MAIEEISLDQLAERLKRVRVTRSIKEIVLHHTWSPTAAQYKGRATWEAIRQYHIQKRGWSDIGYHYGVGPDGSYWLLRPVEKAGAHVQNRNAHTIGVALVGNFDLEDPEAHGLPAAARLVRVLLEHFALKPENIRFHREFQNKTCPGMRIELMDFRQRVMTTMPEEEIRVVLLPQNIIVECRPTLENNHIRCDLRALAEALGADVVDHLREQRKIYVKLKN